MKTYTYPDTPLYINGRWRGGHAPGFTVIDPATETRIGTCAAAGPRDLDEALASTERGFWKWRQASALERCQIMVRAADLLRERIEPIAHLMTMEQGKPLADARAEVAAAADLIDWFANEGHTGPGKALAPRGQTTQLLVKEPVGPVAAFVAWSFPIGQAARKVSAALACGCSVVLVGPDAAPASCAALVVAFADAGLPAGVLNLLYGSQSDIATYLIGHPTITAGSYSGPALLGARLAALAGVRGKSLVLELSGHAPAIVFDDADIELAVRLLCKAKFRNAGQARFAPTRILVQGAVYERFLDDFVEASKNMTVGNGLGDGVGMGPLVSAARLDRMEALVPDAVDAGAALMAGGHRMGNLGFFFWPTVLAGVTTQARVMNAEPFGPIAVVNRFDRREAAIAEVNRLRPSLATYAYTTSEATMRDLGRDIASPTLFINQRDGRSLEAGLGGIGAGFANEDTLESYLQARLISLSA